MKVLDESEELGHARSIVLHANTPGYIARYLRPLPLVQRLAHEESVAALIGQFEAIRTTDQQIDVAKLYLIMAALWIKQTPEAVDALRRCGPDDLHWLGAVKSYMLSRTVPSSLTRRPQEVALPPQIVATQLPASRWGVVHASLSNIQKTRTLLQIK